MKPLSSLVAVLLALGATAAAAHTPGAAPGSEAAAPSTGIARAPAHLRAYFEAARRADALEDKEKRCLAFPDLPGSRWPAGLAKAWCAERKLITMDDVIAHLDRGDLAGLDAAYKRHLERHFSKTDFNELIHNDMMYFGYDERAGEVAARWLKAAPGSAYAHAGRGVHLLRMAWKARGHESIAKTPEENLVKMRALADQAVESMGKALKIEPRLLPMHASLIEVAMLTSQEDIGKAAYQRGAALDPGCRYLTQAMMRAMRPKWGGSYSDMAQYGDLLKPHLARRPLLANSIVIPQVEQAEELYYAKQYQQAIDLLKPAAVDANDPGMYSLLARALERLPKADQWEPLVYLLQGARFVDDNIETERSLARTLLNVGEMEWAIRFGKRALKLEPDDPWASQYMGMAHFYLKQYAQAEPLLLAALKGDETRAPSLLTLVRAMHYGKDPLKAERYAGMLTVEQPDQGFGWYALGVARARQGKEHEVLPAFETFLRVADRADPQQAAMIEQVEAGVARFKKSRAATDANDRKQR